MSGHINNVFTRVQGLCAAIVFSVLTGCGGGGGSDGDGGNPNPPPDPNPQETSFSISGTLAGNAGDVTLSLNGQQQTFTGNAFTFTPEINQGETYGVLFVSESTGLTCAVTNGGGVAQSDVTNVAVTCSARLTALHFYETEVLGDVVTGDFNGDGHADLAITTRTMPLHPMGGDRHLTKFLLGDGAGNFPTQNDVETIELGITNKRGRQSVAADFNGDGFDDYVYYNEVYLGNATGIPARSFVAAAYPGTSLITQDFNNDDTPDILGNTQADTPAMSFGLQISNRDGTFAPVANFVTRTQMNINWVYGMGGFTLADVNGDGVRDIVAVGSEIGSIEGTAMLLRILPVYDDGTIDVTGSVVDLPDDLELDRDVSWSFAKDITSGDFDGDGDIDLAITSDTSFVQVMLNDGAGAFTQGQRVLVGTQPIHIHAGDFNLDGKLDLATANAESNTVHVSYGVGDGTFGDSTGAPESWVSVDLERNADLFDMVIADFDSDGAPDIAVAEDGTNPPDTGRGSVQLVFASGL